jgi:hypothetical protein
VTGTDSNYNLTLVNGALVIGKAGLVVTADNKTRVYGSANPSLTYTLTGFVNSETASVISGAPTLTTNANTSSGVGNIPITATVGNFSAANYSFTAANGSLTVTLKLLIVSAVDQSTTYGTALDLGTNNTGAVRYTTSGLINSDTVTAVVLNQNSNATVPSGQAAGIYTGPTNGIVVGSASGAGLTNYAITYAPASLTIHQKALTISGRSSLCGALWTRRATGSLTTATLQSWRQSLPRLLTVFGRPLWNTTTFRMSRLRNWQKTESPARPGLLVSFGVSDWLELGIRQRNAGDVAERVDGV